MRDKDQNIIVKKRLLKILFLLRITSICIYLLLILEIYYRGHNFFSFLSFLLGIISFQYNRPRSYIVSIKDQILAFTLKFNHELIYKNQKYLIYLWAMNKISYFIVLIFYDSNILLLYSIVDSLYYYSIQALGSTQYDTKNIIISIANNFILTNLCFGYTLICIISEYNLIYIFFLVALISVFWKSKILKSKYFTYSEDFYQNISDELSFGYSLLKCHIGANTEFLEKSLLEKDQREQELNTLESLYQCVFILIHFLLDLHYNKLSDFFKIRILLITYLIYYSQDMLKILSWGFNYFIKGPEARQISLDVNYMLYLKKYKDSKQILTDEQILENYLQLKSQEIYINLKILNDYEFKNNAFRQIIQQQLQQDKILQISFPQRRFSYDKENNLEMSKKLKKLIIYVSCKEFLKFLIDIFNQKKFYEYKIHLNIANRFQKQEIITLIGLNYQIISNLQINESISDSIITTYMVENLKLIIFYKDLSGYMSCSPKQICYDLYDI